MPTWLPSLPAWAHNPETALAAGVILAAGGGLWWWRRCHRPSPEEIERARRLRLHAIGRIAGGEILEMLPAPDAAALAPTLVYQYEVGGVTYQVSQALHLVPVVFDPSSWIPGWPVQVKYDPANPGNSIVACEHWRGLIGTGAHARSARA